MKKVLIDTDILIDFTKGKNKDLLPLLSLQSDGKIQLYITPVNIAEFVNDQHLKTDEKLQKAKEFLRIFSVSEMSATVGFLAGKYRREGSVQFLGDALIAATCVEQDLLLMTRNKRHFKNIADLSLYFDSN